MNRTLPLLFLLACVLLAGFVLAGTTLAQARRKEERRQRRFSDVLDPHARRRRRQTLASVVLTKPDASPTTLSGQIAALFGIAPGRAHVYPMPWWFVLFVMILVAAALSWLTTVLVGKLGWLALPPLWIAASRLSFAMFERRRTAILFKQFPDALAMIVRGVRVGIPVTDTVRTVGIESPQPTSLEFSRLADELAIGVSLEDALLTMARRNSLQEYRFFATAMALQSQTGGRLSETLENLAEVIRKRVAVRARGYALAAEARTSSAVLAILPFISFGGLTVLSPAYAAELFTDPGGRMVLAIAVLELGFGLFVMRTMINKSLS
jgi:tight adherence protein B